MKTLIARLALPALLCSLITSIQPVFAQGTAFTYQGQLSANGGPANGNYDFTFALFNAASGGTQIGITLTNLDVGVTNGLFTAALDFGPVFTGNATWLAIGVETNGGGGFTALSPLQPLTPTPYAIYAPNAGVAANTTGAITVAQLPAAVLTNNDTNVNLSGTFSGNGDGMTNVPGTMPWQTISSTNQTAAANQAYLLTNNALSTVTLPTSANVGDIVTVTGVGTNGWQVLASAGQTIAGYVGPPGLIWTLQYSNIIEEWASVASSSDGTKLVAVDYDQDSDPEPIAIYTSVNSGTNWTPQGTEDIDLEWDSVASSSDGTKLVAVSAQGRIATSTNSGTNWTVQSNVQAEWYSVASSADGTKLVAVGFVGVIGTVFYTSTDSGTTWTPQYTNSARCVASSSDGTKLVAVGGYQISISTDSGTNWIAQSIGSNQYWDFVASSSDGTKLVAVSSEGEISTSTDSGTNWTLQFSASQQWDSVASSSDGTKLVALAENGLIYTSTNSGTNWTPQPSGIQYWASVASSSDGTRLVAVTSQGAIYTSVASPLPFGGVAGTTAQFQYIGNGLWQPLAISASQLGGGSVVTNTESGVTLSGSFSGNGSGLTNLTASSLPVSVVTNNETGVTLSGTFDGTFSGASLGNIPLTNINAALPSNTTWTVTGSQSNGFANPVVFIQNTNTSSLCGPALRVQSFGSNTPEGALSVSAQNSSGLIAEFGNQSAFVCTISNNGSIYANGTIYANGVALTSDRAMKKNFAPVNAQTVLDKVASLPILQWNYKADTADTKHLGPMAQDFQAAFGLDGRDDKHISVVDENGVALAAIQGLNQKLEAETKAKDVEIEALKQSVAELKKMVQTLADKK